MRSDHNFSQFSLRDIAALDGLPFRAIRCTTRIDREELVQVHPRQPFKAGFGRVVQSEPDRAVPIPLLQEAHQNSSESTVHPAARGQIQPYFAGTIFENPIDESQQCGRSRERGWTDQLDPVLIVPLGCLDSSLHDEMPLTLIGSLYNSKHFVILTARPTLTVYHASTQKPPARPRSQRNEHIGLPGDALLPTLHSAPHCVKFAQRFDRAGFVLHDSSVLLLLPLLLSLGNALGSGARVFHTLQTPAFKRLLRTVIEGLKLRRAPLNHASQGAIDAIEHGAVIYYFIRRRTSLV